MKKQTKVLLTLLCAVLLVVSSVFATMAYLTSDDLVENTFTVGKVEIKLDEANVNEYGEVVDNVRVKGNEYKLIPGHTYVKDPTVTVLKDSEETYVRMKVTVNCSSQLDAIFGPDGVNLTSMFKGYDPSNWELVGNVEDTTANTRTYEFRYVGEANKGSKNGTVAKAAADIMLDPLFDQIVVPGNITKENLATLDRFTINVTAEAIQADGFADANAAWVEFVP